MALASCSLMALSRFALASLLSPCLARWSRQIWQWHTPGLGLTSLIARSTNAPSSAMVGAGLAFKRFTTAKAAFMALGGFTAGLPESGAVVVVSGIGFKSFHLILLVPVPAPGLALAH